MVQTDPWGTYIFWEIGNSFALHPSIALGLDQLRPKPCPSCAYGGLQASLLRGPKTQPLFEQCLWKVSLIQRGVLPPRRIRVMDIVPAANP